MTKEDMKASDECTNADLYDWADYRKANSPIARAILRLLAQKEARGEVFKEMRHRAVDGCTGSHDGTCCDPEMEIHPEDWCNRCLMGVASREDLR